jgi:hypothetical protein
MSMALSFALAFRLAYTDRLLSVRQSCLACAAMLAALAALLGALGFVTEAPSHGAGFGIFSADLLAFLNPLDASWLVSRLPAGDGQLEGNAYLGLGGLALLGAVAVLATARWRPGRARLGALAPIFLAALAMAVFALSDRVRLGSREVLDLRAFWHPFGGLVGPFEPLRFRCPCPAPRLRTPASPEEGGSTIRERASLSSPQAGVGKS